MFNWLLRYFRKKEAAIQALDSIDVIGQRQDGGVDLVIIDSNPNDVSPETRNLLEQKIAGYLRAISSDSFQEEFGFPSSGEIRIIVVCRTQPNRKLADWIAEWQPWVEANRARLMLSVGVEGMREWLA